MTSLFHHEQPASVSYRQRYVRGNAAMTFAITPAVAFIAAMMKA
jgi:hypothetical protein